MQAPIYLDYAATTPVDDKVAQAMVDCLTIDNNFGNPASRSHVFGWQAEQAVERARSQLAKLIHADVREIVWTSGATESNNLALKGAAAQYAASGHVLARRKGLAPDEKCGHVITAQTEHKAVLDTCEYLEQVGCRVTYLKPADSGVVAVEQVAEAIEADTFLVSIMHVNNETGVINDIASIGELCREKSIVFHVDAAQSMCRLAIDTSHLPIDMLSMSAHKMYGPKGVGALWVRRSEDVTIRAQIHGGGHERGMRSGTLPTHQIVGMGMAADIARQKREAEAQRMAELTACFESGLRDISGVVINGASAPRVPGIVNASFRGVDGEALLLSLNTLAVSTGSACASASLDPSYVLKAMNVSDELAHSSLRFSFGRYTTEDDIDNAVDILSKATSRLRST